MACFGHGCLGITYDLFCKLYREDNLMLKLIYQLIVFYLITLIIYDVFKERTVWLRLTAALSLIPFVLRFFLIK